MMSKYSLFLLSLSLFFVGLAPVQGQTTFTHYKGVHGKGYDAKGMQQVATYEYYVYVTSTAGPYVEKHNGKYYVKLILPFQKYHLNGSISGGSDLEPYAYFRWFNYKTDLGDDSKLVRYDWNRASTNILQALNFSSADATHAGQPAGWISYNTSNNEAFQNGSVVSAGPGIGKVGCVYELSADCDNADWTGADIACDVSRYCDYNDETNYTPATFTHEPTLSIRYIFHIRPAAQLASAMRDRVITENENRTFEDKKIFVFGAKGTNSVATLHAEMPFPSSYWYYPLTNTNKKHIFLPDGAAEEYKITSADFGTKLKHADRIYWRFYSPDKKMYCQFETNENPTDNVRNQYGRWSRFFDLTIDKLNRASWWNLDGSAAAAKPTISIGQNIYAVYYASDGSSSPLNYAPIGSMRIDLRSFWPMTDAQITASSPSRASSYLEKNYSRSMQAITYDEGLDNTQSAPTSTDDNMAKSPSDFASRAYGFVYRDLISKSWPGLGTGKQAFLARWKNPQHSPLHGEYGIYKSANYYTTGADGTSVNDISLDMHLGSKTAAGAYTNPTTSAADNQNAWTNGQAYMWYYNTAGNRQEKQFFDRTHVEDPSRYGGFLYIDASDESRQIASENFQASLCSGSQLVISAWIASLTSGNNQYDNNNVDPQVQFVLYGIDNKQAAHRLCSFTSGEFTTNAEGFRHIGSQGIWYQVFGRVILPAELSVENYQNFRITLYNDCKSTVGADYAIDDIEIFQRTAKLTVIQNSPICPDQSNNSTVSVSLKIKGNYETLDAVAPGSTLYYKLVKVADGTDVTGTDVYGTGYNNYGKVTIPSAYSADAKLADGTTSQFETEADGSISLVLDNRTFSLDPNSTYYVSIALPSTDNENTPSTAWGNPTASCSTYSPNFSPVQEGYVIDGTSGSTTANINVPCGATDVKDYSIKGTVTTTDPKNGGAVSLPNVAMDWYVGTRSEFNAVAGLLQALKNFRQEYSTGDQTQAPKGVYTTADQTLLAHNVYSTTNATGKLLLSASTALTGYPLAKGSYTVCAIPVSTTVSLTSGSTTTTYTLCPDPIEMKVNARQQGVNLVLGNPNVVYPASSTIRGIRVGLPQLREIQKQTNGALRIPIHERLVERQIATNAKLRFIASPDATNSGVASVFLSDTNDPTFTNDDKGKLVFANITDLTPDYQLEPGSNTLNLRLADDIIGRLHEGYWYELQVMYIQTNAKEGSNACPGETFFRLKIVPEYLTWDYNTNSNWNNDNNWRRSTANELYMADGSYADYGTASKDGARVVSTVTPRNSYAPMYFTKVTIPQSTIYPYLGYIAYESTDDRATRLSNKKGDNAASIDGDLDDISYEMEAYVPTDGSGEGIFDCKNYRGNVCDQLYLKAGAELRSQQFLIYNKAWTELELPVGKWYSVASPLKDTYAGDYYVPAKTGRQETQAFEGISWSSDDNNRVRYPFYQRAWGDATVTEQDGGTGYSAWDNPIAMVPADGTLTENANGWSHVYNNAAAVAGGDDQNANYAFSLRVGDAYMPTQASGLREKMALVRLPKEDATYSYQTVSSDGSPLLTTATLTRTNSGKLRVNADVSETATGQITVTPAAVSPSDNHYYLIANPYTSSISVSQFLADNASALEDQQHVWVLRGDVLTQMPSENANQVSTEYNVIRPQESFFVKMTTTNQLVFNQGQQVDANIRSNTAKAALAKPMFVTYSYDNGSTTNISKVLSEDDGVLKTWCPSSGQLAIAYGGNDALTSLSVYTLDGRLWQILRPSAQTIYVQIPAGVYLVKGMTKKGNAKVNKQVVE